MARSNENYNPACRECSGACCETLVLALPEDNEVAIWLELRGRREGRQVRIAAPCQALDHHGACSIYTTRPEPCRVFGVGSPACSASIRSQRPKDVARLIKLARENQG